MAPGLAGISRLNSTTYVWRNPPLGLRIESTQVDEFSFSRIGMQYAVGTSVSDAE